LANEYIVDATLTVTDMVMEALGCKTVAATAWRRGPN
jgi:hypothetical protein